MRTITLLCVAGSLACAAVTVTVRGTTATQAILSYNLSAPSGSACLVEISESPSYAPLIHDVDGSLFSGSNRDSRSGSVLNGGSHVFVAGTRGAAQLGLDVRRYSRALAANTIHYFRINNDSACDSGGVAAGSFVTGTLPMGRMYNDPIPTDPSHPGITAWPEIRGASRIPAVDPQTGARYVPMTVPGDQPALSGSGTNFGSPFDASGTWACTAGAAPCTFSGTNSAKLVLPFDPGQAGALQFFLGGSYETVGTQYLDWINNQLTMYCSGAGCGAAPAANHIADFCLSVNGVTCASAVIQKTLGNSSAVVGVGGTNVGMTDWLPWTTPIDHVLATQQAMAVTISGANVTYADNSNQHFRSVWTNGTRATLSGAGCASPVTIASLADDQHLVLTSSPGCSSGTLTVTPFTLLVWKDNISTDTFTLSAAHYDWQSDFDAPIESSAMQDGLNSCGGPPITVSGNAGYLCYNNGDPGAWYWVSATGNTVNYLGRWNVAVTGAPLAQIPDGQGDVCAFDLTNAGVVYCGLVAFQGETTLVKVAFSGPFTGVSPGFDVTPVSTPSVSITVLETGLLGKLMTYSPAFAASCCGGSLRVYGENFDGSFNIQVHDATTQNFSGWEAIYDPLAGGYVAVRGTLADGAGIHSVIPRHGILAGYGQQLDFIAGRAPGPLSGTDTTPTAGPYRVRVPGGISGSSSACPARPVNSPIPAVWWPGGAQNLGPNACVTITVANTVLADPSPYTLSINVTATNGSSAISTTGTFLQTFSGKPITINGTQTRIAPWPGGWIDNQHMVLTGNFTGVTFTGNATLQAEPTCAQHGVTCDVSTDHDFRALAPGDMLLVGEPTPGVTGYNTCHLVEFHSVTECFQVLTVSGSSIVMQRAYSKGSTLQAWPATTYLYLDARWYNYFIDDGSSNYDSFWDYRNFPNGGFFLQNVDTAPSSGHAYFTAAGDFGFYGNTQAGCVPQVLWNGNTITDCYGIRFGTNFTYASQPIITRPFGGTFAGILGMGDPYGGQAVVDDHPTFPYLSQAKFLMGARMLNSDNGTPGTPASPCSNVSGSLYKCSAAQRGYQSSAAALKGDRTLPIHAFCGQQPMLNVSGPGATIDGTSANSYKYLTVVAANEGVTGTSPGDVLMNCPFSSAHFSSTGIADSGALGNGGDLIDMSVIPSGPWVHGFTQIDFASNTSSLTGGQVRWIGHGLQRYHWYNIFSQFRATPDGRGGIFQSTGVDGFKTQLLLAPLPPIVYDSINGADFVPVTLSLNAPAGLGIDNAIVEYGYAENGSLTGGPFCTPRQESCVRGNQTGNIFNYETSEAGLYSGQACSSVCAITIPAISQRSLYYRVKFRSGNSVQFTLPLEVIAVP